MQNLEEDEKLSVRSRMYLVSMMHTVFHISDAEIEHDKIHTTPAIKMRFIYFFLRMWKARKEDALAGENIPEHQDQSCLR